MTAYKSPRFYGTLLYQKREINFVKTFGFTYADLELDVSMTVKSTKDAVKTVLQNPELSKVTITINISLDLSAIKIQPKLLGKIVNGVL